jgi:hypothetical protein
MVTTHQTIQGQLGGELIQVRMIRSFMVFYKELDVTWHNVISNGL